MTSGQGQPGDPSRATAPRSSDEDGEEVPPGVDGRLAVIGPVGCRYLDDERQAGYVVNGWNVTGDTFYRDEDGYFFYRARTDNMIISSGYNISGAEVETVIDTHPDVVESAVVARPDADRGSVVCAFVVLKEGVVGDEAEVKAIQTYVKQQLAPYKYPRDVRFAPALPRNTSGKLQHFRLRDQVMTEQESGPDEDRDRRRRAGRALLRRADEGSRPVPRDHRVGAQRPGRHVRLRGGLLR